MPCTLPDDAYPVGSHPFYIRYTLLSLRGLNHIALVMHQKPVGLLKVRNPFIFPGVKGRLQCSDYFVPLNSALFVDLTNSAVLDRKSVV